MKNYQTFKKQLLENNKVKQAFDELEPEQQLIKSVIQLRLKHGLTQKQLAKKSGTKQPSISRLESGEYNPTLNFLKKIAVALDAKLKISIQ